jgi:acyl-CoA dehydrogenase
VVDADASGLSVEERIAAIAPHPFATIGFRDCFVPAGNMLGRPGEGFKVAMSTLDIFRPSVGAAALGLGRRALAEAIGRVRERQMFGGPMAQLQTVQTKLADMALEVDASALLVYRAAWVRDVRGGRATREAAMAKLQATEAANRVIDAAVQVFGGLGVRRGTVVEALYREIRPMRIYEGASEVQRLVIGRDLLRASAEAGP